MRATNFSAFFAFQGRLRDTGRDSIFGGFNRLSGSYALVDNTVTMGSLVSTRMAGDPALMEREQQFAKALTSVDVFQVFGNDLTLSSK